MPQLLCYLIELATSFAKIHVQSIHLLDLLLFSFIYNLLILF